MADQVLLPHKLSELAQMALDDVEAIERSGIHGIEMASWCRWDSTGGPCAMCAAGAVAVQRLGLSRTVVSHVEFYKLFGDHNADALVAVDQLRMGNVGAALLLVEGSEDWETVNDSEEHELNREIPRYGIDMAGWHAGMRALIADLREAGL
ncbi:MAG TPA: hypothetical protein VL494_13430 [Steroidobacteraceae bacterium]|jgi:hypothetical protein|nr:hypothetical protein [Steroidobacteraceae bacterium]